MSPELVFNVERPDQPIEHKRMQAAVAEEGDVVSVNPNSALVWQYSEYDWNGDGQIAEFEEKMHRTIGTPAIKDDLLFIADFSGLLHCLDVATGKAHWTFDMFAACWSSPLIVEDKVYIGSEEGIAYVFGFSADPDVAMRQDAVGRRQPLGVNEMGNSIYSTAVVANDVLYIANKTHLFAIQADAEKATVGAQTKTGP